MTRRLLVIVCLAAVLAGCGSPSSPQPTPSPTPAATPSVAALASGGPFDGQPYTLTLPAGWQAFNLNDPSAQASIDAFIAANPSFASAMTMFKSMPGVRMAVNPLLGNLLLVITLPTNGLSLETLTATFGSQFQAVPGLQGTAEPEDTTLGGEPAKHWDLNVTGNKPDGGMYTVEESVYLTANDTDAAILEFVTLSGGAIPDEQAIVDSFAFN